MEIQSHLARPLEVEVSSQEEKLVGPANDHKVKILIVNTYHRINAKLDCQIHESF